jgi:hypothetical protein
MGAIRWLRAARIDQRLLTPGRGLASFLADLAALDHRTDPGRRTGTGRAAGIDLAEPVFQGWSWLPRGTGERWDA